MSDKFQTQEQENSQSLANPRPGDYWQEMFCPYFLVVDVRDDKITVLSCMGGPNSYSRKHEPNARVDVQDGWHFDYSKSMVVDRKWISKAVRYDTIDGFAADVINSEKTRGIVDEWRDWTQQHLRQRIAELEAEWEQFTGWHQLKDEKLTLQS